MFVSVCHRKIHVSEIIMACLDTLRIRQKQFLRKLYHFMLQKICACKVCMYDVKYFNIHKAWLFVFTHGFCYFQLTCVCKMQMASQIQGTVNQRNKVVHLQTRQVQRNRGTRHQIQDDDIHFRIFTYRHGGVFKIIVFDIQGKWQVLVVQHCVSTFWHDRCRYKCPFVWIFWLWRGKIETGKIESIPASSVMFELQWVEYC